MKIRFLNITYFLLILLIVFTNGCTTPRNYIIHLSKSNSRETYFSIHNIEQAHKISKGDSVKIGLLDGFFGMDKHPELYDGGKDFSNSPDDLHKHDMHGYWMAETLREIAPESEIYALNISATNEQQGLTAIVAAIEWAIENEINILTFTGPVLPPSIRSKVDDIVNEAIESGIVTTFIHYDNPRNIEPKGLFNFEDEDLSKNYINVFHYDYNTLHIANYSNYINANEKGEEIKNGVQIPYLSLSSTSIVAAGFVAILKSINPNLTPEEYKTILISTSFLMEWNDPYWGQVFYPKRVVDIGKAAEYLISQK